MVDQVKASLRTLIASGSPLSDGPMLVSAMLRLGMRSVMAGGKAGVCAGFAFVVVAAAAG